MRSTFMGFEGLALGFRDALDGGPCPNPNLCVRLVHWDDFETRAELMRRARASGADLILLRIEEKGKTDTVPAAGLNIRIDCVLALGGRFTARQCMPWVTGGKLTFLVPVDPGYEECFVMGDQGQFVGADGKPQGQVFQEGVTMATKRIGDCVQMRLRAEA